MVNKFQPIKIYNDKINNLSIKVIQLFKVTNLIKIDIHNQKIKDITNSNNIDNLYHKINYILNQRHNNQFFLNQINKDIISLKIIYNKLFINNLK